MPHHHHIQEGQTTARPSVKGGKERPIFRTEDPATGKAGRTYQGHTKGEALTIAHDCSRGIQELAAQTL